MECRSCGVTTQQVLDLGPQPIANGFLTEADFEDEFWYDLEVVACPNCSLVQLKEQPAPRRMFGSEYLFKAASSRRMIEHFNHLAATLAEDFLPSKVIEIGTNDGTLLRAFDDFGICAWGVDPMGGKNVLPHFFNLEMAKEIRDTLGPIDLVVATNTLSHIADIHGVLGGVRHLLKPTGVFVVEEPYLPQIIEKTAFDQFYDEHVFYFSIDSISRSLAAHDLRISSTLELPVHGGSMRYFIRPSKSSLDYFKTETALCSFKGFRERMNANCRRLRMLLESYLNFPDFQVAGYGATSKSTTVINYAKIDISVLPAIYDTIPEKIGRFSPGAHIPIRSFEEATKTPPTHSLLFAWNHKEEIFEKEAAWRAGGGKFIIYIPKVEVL